MQRLRVSAGLGGKRLFLVLGGVTMVGPAAMDMYLPGLPELARDFGVSASAAQVTVATYVIGLAAGQLIAGPLSDVHGRRRPLIVGMALFTVASLVCSVAPNLSALAAMRFVQGLTAAAGMTIGRAAVRDLFSGAAAARYLSRLILVIGLAPILAPVIGSQILGISSWRGVFVALALLGLSLTLMALWLLPETLPHDRRRVAGFQLTTQTFGYLLRERRFLGFVLVCGLSAGAMLAYIAGSPFVLQDIYGASPQLYGLLFATNALALVVGAQINAHLVMGRDPQRLLGFGLAMMVAAGAVLIAVVSLLPGAGLVSVMPALTLLLFSWSFIQANAVAAALTDHPQVAGTAAALLGVSQFALGAPLVPLVGVRGDDTALPMAIVILACGISASLAFRALVLSTSQGLITTAPRASDV